MVAHEGFKPSISCLRGRRLWSLAQCAMKAAPTLGAVNPYPWRHVTRFRGSATAFKLFPLRGTGEDAPVVVVQGDQERPSQGVSGRSFQYQATERALARSCSSGILQKVVMAAFSLSRRPQAALMVGGYLLPHFHTVSRFSSIPDSPVTLVSTLGGGCGH